MRQRKLEQDSLVSTAFSGQSESLLRCENCNQTSQHQHHFFGLPLELFPPSDSARVIGNRKLYNEFLPDKIAVPEKNIFNFLQRNKVK